MDVFALKEVREIDGELGKVLNITPVDFDVEWVLVGGKAHNLVTEEVLPGFEDYTTYYTSECTMFLKPTHEGIHVKVFHRDGEWSEHLLPYENKIRDIISMRDDLICVWTQTSQMLRVTENLKLERVKGPKGNFIFAEDENNYFTEDTLVYKGIKHPIHTTSFNSQMCTFDRDEIIYIALENKIERMVRIDRNTDEAEGYKFLGEHPSTGNNNMYHVFNKKYICIGGHFYFNDGITYRKFPFAPYPVVLFLGKYFLSNDIILVSAPIEEMSKIDRMFFSMRPYSNNNYYRGLHRLYESRVDISDVLRMRTSYLKLPFATMMLAHESVASAIMRNPDEPPVMFDTFIAGLPEVLHLGFIEERDVLMRWMWMYRQRGRVCPLVFHPFFSGMTRNIDIDTLSNDMKPIVEEAQRKLQRVYKYNLELPYDAVKYVDFVVLKGASYERCLRIATYLSGGVWFNMPGFPLFPGFVHESLWNKNANIAGGSASSTYLVYDMKEGSLIA